MAKARDMELQIVVGKWPRVSAPERTQKRFNDVGDAHMAIGAAIYEAVSKFGLEVVESSMSKADRESSLTRSGTTMEAR
ncbi:MAG TPA: hypothetical protein VGR87_06035 [Candidatus Limnocylindria bacterium]|nr:hypothetical protein [Candidatus Limnocylindria bacterium]